jgi:TFIIH basal transcription factor complex TTD-A subunit
MLVDIDNKNNNEFIIEELDEEHILVKETKINELKARLNQVIASCERKLGMLT